MVLGNRASNPSYGTRPWGVAHIDHTQLDIELVSCARTGRSLGRPWATFLMDAFTRRLLVRLSHVRSTQLSLSHDGLTRMCLALRQTSSNHRR